MNFLFGFFGTFNRTQWWIAQLLIIPISFFLYLISTLLFLNNYNLLVTAIYAVMIMGIVISCAASAKRFRDRGKSGMWSLIYFIPFGAVWILIECGFFPGGMGSTRFDNSSDDETDAHTTYSDAFKKDESTVRRTDFGINNSMEIVKPKPLFGV